jgi:hypothetical protein
MGLFGKKPVKEIQNAAWGTLVNEFKIDVDSLSRDYRCVQKDAVMDGQGKVQLLRIFCLSDVQAKNIQVAGWETFDEHPELVVFEGYVTPNNKASIQKKT